MTRTPKRPPEVAQSRHIARARGKALLLEIVAAGWGQGMSSAPRKDWVSERLGPNPPGTLAEIGKNSYAEVLAACG